MTVVSDKVKLFELVVEEVDAVPTEYCETQHLPSHLPTCQMSLLRLIKKNARGVRVAERYEDIFPGSRDSLEHDVKERLDDYETFFKVR